MEKKSHFFILSRKANKTAYQLVVKLSCKWRCGLAELLISRHLPKLSSSSMFPKTKQNQKNMLKKKKLLFKVTPTCCYYIKRTTSQPCMNHHLLWVVFQSLHSALAKNSSSFSIVITVLTWLTKYSSTILQNSYN